MNTFIGLDSQVAVRHMEDSRTFFHVIEIDGEQVGEIVFGSDIYPGLGVADPNSSLSMQAAAAHELSHFYRWRDKTQIDEEDFEEIDEALTSLEAIQRFPRALSEHDNRQLVADAIQRLMLFVQRKAI